MVSAPFRSAEAATCVSTQRTCRLLSVFLTLFIARLVEVVVVVAVVVAVGGVGGCGVFCFLLHRELHAIYASLRFCWSLSLSTWVFSGVSYDVDVVGWLFFKKECPFRKPIFLRLCFDTHPCFRCCRLMSLADSYPSASTIFFRQVEQFWADALHNRRFVL